MYRYVRHQISEQPVRNELNSPSVVCVAISEYVIKTRNSQLVRLYIYSGTYVVRGGAHGTRPAASGRVQNIIHTHLNLKHETMDLSPTTTSRAFINTAVCCIHVQVTYGYR